MKWTSCLEKEKVNLHMSRVVFFCLNLNLCDDLYDELINTGNRPTLLHSLISLSIVILKKLLLLLVVVVVVMGCGVGDGGGGGYGVWCW